MNFYECLGVSRNASPVEMDAAFSSWHSQFARNREAGSEVDLAAAKQVCEAYRVLADPQHRRNYDELLIWVQSPALDPAISDEQFHAWLQPGKSVAAGLTALRSAELEEARRFRRIATASLERAITSRQSWVGITCWTLTWLSGVAILAVAWLSLHRIFELTFKLHR